MSWIGKQCLIVGIPDQDHELSTLDNFLSVSVFWQLFWYSLLCVFSRFIIIREIADVL